MKIFSPPPRTNLAENISLPCMLSYVMRDCQVGLYNACACVCGMSYQNICQMYVKNM